MKDFKLKLLNEETKHPFFSKADSTTGKFTFDNYTLKPKTEFSSSFSEKKVTFQTISISMCLLQSDKNFINFGKWKHRAVELGLFRIKKKTRKMILKLKPYSNKPKFQYVDIFENEPYFIPYLCINILSVKAANSLKKPTEEIWEKNVEKFRKKFGNFEEIAKIENEKKLVFKKYQDEFNVKLSKK